MSDFKGIAVQVGDHQITQPPGLNLGWLTEWDARFLQSCINPIQIIDHQVSVRRPGSIRLGNEMHFGLTLLNDHKRDWLAVRERDCKPQDIAVEIQCSIDVRDRYRRRNAPECWHGYDRNERWIFCLERDAKKYPLFEFAPSTRSRQTADRNWNLADFGNSECRQKRCVLAIRRTCRGKTGLL